MQLANFARRLFTGQWAYILHALRQRWQGVDLSGASLEQIGLRAEESHYHAQSGGPDLRHVMREIGVPAGSRIIDFGSGKGGAGFTLAECGFDEVMLVELSESLHATAMVNARKLMNARKLAVAPVLCCRNAASVVSPELDRFTHVYMFNPFPPPVVAHVLQNIVESIENRPRPLTLILKWPCTPEDIVRPFPFEKTREFHPRGSHPFYIFEHRTQFVRA